VIRRTKGFRVSGIWMLDLLPCLSLKAIPISIRFAYRFREAGYLTFQALMINLSRISVLIPIHGLYSKVSGHSALGVYISNSDPRRFERAAYLTSMLCLGKRSLRSDFLRIRLCLKTLPSLETHAASRKSTSKPCYGNG
jgi:hypothetical protein